MAEGEAGEAPRALLNRTTTALGLRIVRYTKDSKAEKKKLLTHHTQGPLVVAGQTTSSETETKPLMRVAVVVAATLNFHTCSQ